MSHVSGIAASIRNATESETFDLAGQTVATIEKQIRDAFTEPLPLTEMIRLTFITGAGKLGRQKYDEGAAKAVTGVLRDLGYEEDRAASAVLDCAGTFKLQHDTGKNLKTVVVFPKVVLANTTNTSTDAPPDGSRRGGTLLAEGSPEHKLAYSTMNVFERNIDSKCKTWSQKKSGLTVIESMKDTLKTLEAKLVSGAPLTETEQEMYDSVSMTSLEEKQAHLKKLMQQQVEKELITAQEKNVLLNQVKERLQTLAKEIAEAENEGKEKRLANLLAAKEKAEERKGMIEKISPKPPPPLKNEIEINKLREELRPLQELEENAKGRLLTLKESQSLARKEEMLNEIAKLEEQSREWFESDEEFASRLQQSRSDWQGRVQAAKKKASKPVASGTASSTSTKWLTPTTRKPAAPKEKKAQQKGGGLFAAMMADSDSD